MRFLFLLLLTAAFPAAGQPTDTLYYDLSWNLVNPEEAFFYRTVRVDRAELVFEGPVKDYLKSSGKLLLEGTYRNGRKEGRFTFYHENGRPESTGDYADNIKTGEWQYYYPNGKLRKIIQFTSTGNQPYCLWAQWDSTGRQEVEAGNGYWYDYDRDVATGKTIKIRGKVLNGQRSEAWVLEYQNGAILYEEFFRSGRFLSGDVWNRGRQRPYYQSRLDLTDPAEILLPEFFSYDAGQFDRDYYGQGLAYFLAKYLALGAGTSFGEVSYQRVNSITNACSKGTFSPAAFPGGPLELYRFLKKQQRVGADTGLTLVHIAINDLGMVRDCYVVKGIGSKQNQKAVEIIRNTRWIPASCNLTPAKSYLRVAIP